MPVEPSVLRIGGNVYAVSIIKISNCGKMYAFSAVSDIIVAYMPMPFTFPYIWEVHHDSSLVINLDGNIEDAFVLLQAMVDSQPENNIISGVYVSMSIT